MSDLLSLYPEIEPYESGRLKVDDRHEIYFEQVGNPEGVPVVFLHGGPGGGCSTNYRRFFDPKHYRVILFDQRGAGKSTPHADLVDNTTWHLVDDIEKIRDFVGVDKWIVFGGSWGSTLSLAYAETHPDRVLGLALRGIFLCRPKEIQWFYQEGGHRIFPDAWEKYIEIIPEEERSDLVQAYYKRLTSDDPKIRLTAAKAWSVWEASCSFLLQRKELMESFEDPEFAAAFARIECHYFTNNSFFETDNWLIENVHKINHIPTQIVHGRYDVVCPIESCWELHKAFPESKLHIIEDAGHSAMEAGITDRLIRIMEDFKSIKI